MPPSKIRKEEAELRQIAKQSRQARKDAQLRERKQKKREERARAAAEAAGGEAGEHTRAPAPSPAAAKKRRGAIILPEEVAELQQRLSGHTPSAAPAAKKGKKAAKKGSLSAGDSPAKAAASSGSSPGAYAEPSHHVEVHYKRKQVLVDVTLHHVPHSKIDLSETSATQLVVDTTKHTKKYRLVLPFPGGMRVQEAEATYELESGILRCVLPIEGGTVPSELQERWDALQERIQQQKAMRFRTGVDGELTVRTRQALLAKSTEEQAALHEAKTAGKRARDPEEMETEAPGVAGTAARKEGRAAAKIPRRERTDSADETAHARPSPSPSTARGRQEKRTAPAPSGTDDVFAADRARMVEAAKSAAVQAHQSIRDRVKLARAVQQKRQERLSTRTSRRDRKQEKKEESFQRVLEDQKRQLVAKAELQASKDAAQRAQPAAGKRKAPAGKSVSFSV